MVLTTKPSRIDGSTSAVSWTDPQVLDNCCDLSIEISQLSEGVRSAASSFQLEVIYALVNRLVEIWKHGIALVIKAVQS